MKKRGTEEDYFTIAGASALKRQIEDYWMRRGFVGIEATIVPVGDGYVVRSNMVNGVPPGPVVQVQAA